MVFSSTVRRLLTVLAAAAALSATPAGAFAPAGADADDSRWQLTASGATGSAGDPVTLTWSFVPDGTLVGQPSNLSDRDPSLLIGRLDVTFGAGPGGSDLTQRPWFTHFEQSFDRWSALSGVTYVYEPNDTTTSHGVGAGVLGTRGDVRIGGVSMDGVGGTLAYNYFPGDGGDMALDTDDLNGSFADPTGDYVGLRNVIMHEAAHGLGLDHTFSSNASFLLESSIDTSFDGPQHDDLRGIHWMYGDVYEKAPAGRNDAAATATPLGVLSAGAPRVLGAGGTGTVIGPNETDFVSISNQNDADFFSFTIGAPMSIDLTMTPRGASYLQDPTPFVTTETSDLSVALFDTDGVTLLAESASGAAGVAESIGGFDLTTPGTYFARVRGPVTVTEQVTQFYRLDLAGTALAPALVGDFTGDGVVDAADYTLWRGEDGLFRTPFTGADHTGDGAVDAEDYALWAANFGATLGGAAAAVPEPSAGLLLLGAGCLACGRSGRRRLAV